MQFQTLPRTNLRVSNLCLGTADFGASVNETDSFELLDQFFDAGGNFLDTAAIYADWTSAGKGSSEKLLGRWLQTTKKEVVLATKGGHPELHAMQAGRLSRAEIEADLNASLKNLGRETLDLYYLHRDDSSQPIEEILATLERLKTQGKIRFYAHSNWKLERAEAARIAAEKMGVTGFIASQLMWSLANADMAQTDSTLANMTDEYRVWHEKHGFAAIPYSAQATGFFQKMEQRGQFQSAWQTTYDHPQNYARFERLKELQADNRLSTTQCVLGYLLGHPFVTVPIVGPKTRVHLHDCLEAADAKLTPDEIAFLEQ